MLLEKGILLDFFLLRILMSLHRKLKSYAQQDLKWHGGIKNVVFALGRAVYLEASIINWKQSPLSC